MAVRFHRWRFVLAVFGLLVAAPFLPAWADAQDGDGTEGGDDDGGDDDADGGRGASSSAAGSGNRSGEGDGDGDDEEDDGDDDGDTGEGTRGDDRAARVRDHLGEFDVVSDEVTGRYVAFRIDAAAQDLVDVRVANVSVFDRVSATGPFDDLDAHDDRGDRRLEFEGDDVRLTLHDNPAALFKFEADHDHLDAESDSAFDGDDEDDEDDGDGGDGDPDGDDAGDASTPTDGLAHVVVGATFTLDFADGVTVNRTGNRTLNLSWENGSARLHSDHDIVGDGDAATVTGNAVFVVHGLRTLLPDAANRNRDAIDEGLAGGVVGAEVTIVRGADDRVVTDTVATRDLDVAVNDTGDGVRVVIDSADHRGTVVVLNVDRGLLRDDVRVRFWDVSANATELPIVRASSLEDVLDPNDDGLVPEYRLVRDDDGWQLLLSIPGFSAKMVELAPASVGLIPILPVAKEHPLLVGGLFAAVAALGVAAAAMFRRPRDET